MKAKDLVKGDTYLIDIGLSSKKAMKYIGPIENKGRSIYAFAVMEHFMDAVHDNYEVDDTWCTTLDNVYAYSPKSKEEIRKEAEDKILEHLKEAWNLFLSVNSENYAVPFNQNFMGSQPSIMKTRYKCNPDDVDEFRKSINSCQRVIAAQQHMRDNPNFTQYPNQQD